MIRRSWYADDQRLHAAIDSAANAVRELAEHVDALGELGPLAQSALAEVRARAGRPRGRAAQRSPYEIGGSTHDRPR